IMVSVGTFDWSSFRYVVKAPKGDAAVMLVTVAIVVATNDLSKGVIAGVILSAIFFVAKISKVNVTKQKEMNQLIFQVHSQLIFAYVESFMNAFDLSIQNKDIQLDFSNAQIWDESAAAAIDKVMQRYRENKNHIILIGLNSSSEKMIDKLTIQRV